MFQRHPWLAPALSVTRPQPIARGYACAEWVLSALVNLELEAEAEAASGLNSEEWLDTQGPAMRSIVEAARLPVFARVTAADTRGQ
jgi:hypothetical protein